MIVYARVKLPIFGREESKQSGGPESGPAPKRSEAWAAWGTKILIIAQPERAWMNLSKGWSGLIAAWAMAVSISGSVKLSRVEPTLSRARFCWCNMRRLANLSGCMLGVDLMGQPRQQSCLILVIYFYRQVGSRWGPLPSSYDKCVNVEPRPCVLLSQTWYNYREESHIKMCAAALEFKNWLQEDQEVHRWTSNGAYHVSSTLFAS
jgi:hypothetical protein